MTVQTAAGIDCPDTLYWPQIHGETVGALRTEISYFLDCVTRGRAPQVVTPADARAAVSAAERSARSGRVVKL
jgi:hypothetical protein